MPRGGLKGLEFKCEKPAWVFSRCADAHRCTCESLLDVFQAAAPLAHVLAEHLIEEKSRGGLLVNGERPSAVVELLLGS